MSAHDEETKAQELVIIRRPLGGEDAPHKGGVWKIAYADFMTAMMAFFLVMWLINASDKQTLTQVATYFNPLRLTDKVALSKGMHQSDAVAQSTEKSADHAKPGATKEAKEKHQASPKQQLGESEKTSPGAKAAAKRRQGREQGRGRKGQVHRGCALPRSLWHACQARRAGGCGPGPAGQRRRGPPRSIRSGVPARGAGRQTGRQTRDRQADTDAAGCFRERQATGKGRPRGRARLRWRPIPNRLPKPSKWPRASRTQTSSRAPT